ncbi:MAG: YebC/PmpR family DNA-binding transcriptional regulator [Candidatus Marinimicrobia bacterium]|nr:YebC/PmpR family DNA-binding transcriptional regulator [Candidatus Neomarinimicrobiota bacterium]|tara:strand:- start:131 stop:874 length:744 start_codon:yes stop_codon:yes gene_type:complete
MAGHSKWANIKHRKGAQDAKRGKIFTKIIKEITIAARLNGGDVDSNPRLRKAVSNAKSSNMPADKIERAIKKGTGELEGVTYEEITYEGYGPGGMALMMDVITDNKNRSVAEVRHIFSKFGGNLGENGSVSWMFEKKGQIILNSDSGDEDVIFEAALEAGADDFESDDNIYAIFTDPTGLMEIRDSLENSGYKIRSTEIEMIPKTLQKLDGKEAETAMKLMDALDENDDISKLYSNLDIDLESLNLE